MDELVLNYKGRDSHNRPVYEANGHMYAYESSRRLYVDIDPRKDWNPRICTKYNNEFDGEPDVPISEDVKITFVPHRDTWGKEDILTEAVEVCPYCGSENVFANWDVEKQGYVATCWQCGRKIMLCDECLHADDNLDGKCDWHEIIREGKCVEGHCFRGVTIQKNKEEKS